MLMRIAHLVVREHQTGTSAAVHLVTNLLIKGKFDGFLFIMPNAYDIRVGFRHSTWLLVDAISITLLDEFLHTTHTIVLAHINSFVIQKY